MTSETQQATVKVPKKRLSKNQKKRLKQKQKKKQENTTVDVKNVEHESVKANSKPDSGETPAEPAVQVEYVGMDLSKEISRLGDFSNVLEKFMKPEELIQDKTAKSKEQNGTLSDNRGEEKEQVHGDDEHDTSIAANDNEQQEQRQLTKRERKDKLRLEIAQLKQLVERPDVVEQHDVTASDPRFLVYLKAYRNTVPVPRHWLQKRKYLQGKRGIEKPPFELPSFIADTGIGKVRSTAGEDDGSTSKSKQRDRMKPKMGKIDLDYQVLMDAFFKHQTKPKLTNHGDLYYEGKEYEVQVKEKIPGVLSKELQEALGMPPGAPPPWLIHMQRVGPPPSYPQLKIPGLNAPIPSGAKWGFESGGWGQAPVDQYNNPLYGDVFGTNASGGHEIKPVDETPWGELESDAESSEDSESESDMDEEDEYVAQAPAVAIHQEEESINLVKQPSAHTIPEEPPVGLINMQKGASREAENSEPKSLYKVLPTQQANVEQGSLYGASHTYVVTNDSNKRPRDDAQDEAAQEVTLKASKSKRKKRKEQDDDDFGSFKF